jgi:molybdopterin converting factor subunit 1
MTIRLLLFAAVRDIVGRDEVRLDLAEGSTPADLWARLRTEHPRLAPYQSAPAVAINQAFADPATPLRDGDEVAFIPPVSGG